MQRSSQVFPFYLLYLHLIDSSFDYKYIRARQILPISHLNFTADLLLNIRNLLLYQSFNSFERCRNLLLRGRDMGQETFFRAERWPLSVYSGHQNKKFPKTAGDSCTVSLFHIGNIIFSFINVLS